MSFKGPTPLPMAIKIAKGYPGKRSLNAQEPSPDGIRDVTAPDVRSSEAAAVWARIAPELSQMGVLTTADIPTLTRYCQMSAIADEALSTLREKGSTYERYGESKLGEIYRTGITLRPEVVGIYQKFCVSLLRIEQEFGLTPASRTRVKVVEEEEDELAEFFRNR